MKVKYNFNFMKEVTMLDFRRNAQRYLAALRRGERLLLTYRGRPIARLEPVTGGAVAEGEEDALMRLDEYAVDGPGGRLDSGAIDRVLYGG